MPQSNSSSMGSGHSLRSKGPVEASNSATTRCEQGAKWTTDEDTALIEYLCLHIPSDGTNFKKQTWHGTAAHLKERFPEQLGGEKTQSSCQTRWIKLKNGAGITLEYESTWINFLKSHKNTSSFKNTGFPHFDAIHQILPRKSKGTWVHHNDSGQPAGTASSAVSAVALPEASTVPPPQPLTTLNLSQLTAATNEIISIPSHIQSASGLPQDIPPSLSAVPSTFLAAQTTTTGLGAMSSVLTSVSHQDKCKVSAIDSEAAMSASKWSQPVSASVQAQHDGSKAMNNLTITMEEIWQIFARTSARASMEDFGCAISMVSQCATLSSDERIDVIDFLGQDDKHVVKFLNMDESLWLMWVQRWLADLHAATQS
ncbi:uncharacterized protein F5891DRAFT_977518 [Suillus fuscotomentosus]|uniref:Myb-like domain-containing protein n=1 Tax=Suillus fuscotomentosus TaxID=1912939 RepID=A0AAD4EDH7_9AGAM|nr:uncharacterized protein F5891DRAFT_977518 [Suillus fuscotomentosus]KAG1904007.1 hypothetical protein F5891DRAFT_977518 [Suillus fuscotomentosus]